MTQRNMKENQHVQPIIAEDFSSVTFRTKGHPDIVLDMAKLHASIVKRAAAVGFAQVRIVDAAAVGLTDDDGNIIPEEERIAMKYANMAALVEHYHTGTSEWSRVGGGTGGGSRSLTIEAIARVQKVDYAEAEARVARFADTGKDEKGRAFAGDRKKALAFLRNGRQVAEAMDAIRRARAPQPKVDADEALKELA